MILFLADETVGFGRCVHFWGGFIGLDNYKGKEFLSRVVHLLMLVGQIMDTNIFQIKVCRGNRL